MKAQRSTFERQHWHTSIISEHFSFDYFLITAKNVLELNIYFQIHVILDKMAQI